MRLAKASVTSSTKSPRRSFGGGFLRFRPACRRASWRGSDHEPPVPNGTPTDPSIRLVINGRTLLFAQLTSFLALPLAASEPVRRDHGGVLDLCCLVDAMGKPVTRRRFETIGSIIEGLTPMRVDGRFGYLDVRTVASP